VEAMPPEFLTSLKKSRWRVAQSLLVSNNQTTL